MIDQSSHSKFPWYSGDLNPDLPETSLKSHCACCHVISSPPTHNNIQANNMTLHYSLFICCSSFGVLGSADMELLVIFHLSAHHAQILSHCIHNSIYSKVKRPWLNQVIFFKLCFIILYHVLSIFHYIQN